MKLVFISTLLLIISLLSLPSLAMAGDHSRDKLPAAPNCRFTFGQVDVGGGNSPDSKAKLLRAIEEDLNACQEAFAAAYGVPKFYFELPHYLTRVTQEVQQGRIQPDATGHVPPAEVQRVQRDVSTMMGRFLDSGRVEFYLEYKSKMSRFEAELSQFRESLSRLGAGVAPEPGASSDRITQLEKTLEKERKRASEGATLLNITLGLNALCLLMIAYLWRRT